MAQSVELTFDAAADLALTDQWRRLAEAGLPTAQRAQPSEHHRPHITLFAGDRISAAAEDELPGAVRDLDLTLRVGSVMLFGPRRGCYVLVRQVVASAALLTLQDRVVEICGADLHGQFGLGRWTPHVTLAARVNSAQVGACLDVLGPEKEVVASVRDCRRWDGEARVAWWLSGGLATDAEEQVGRGRDGQ